MRQRDRGGGRAGRGLAEFHVQDGAARSLEGMGFAADGDGVEGIDLGNHAGCLFCAGNHVHGRYVLSGMNQALLTALQYYGAGAATLAALLVSLNLGRRITGWAFVLFVTSSIALIGWGFLDKDSEGIGWQNVALLAINAVGVWRYLISKHALRDR